MMYTNLTPNDDRQVMWTWPMPSLPSPLSLYPCLSLFFSVASFLPSYESSCRGVGRCVLILSGSTTPRPLDTNYSVDWSTTGDIGETSYIAKWGQLNDD